MSPSAFVLGGNGLIGRALVPALVDAGYEVSVGSRSGAEPWGPAQPVVVDRADDASFLAATREGFDLFVDVVAYNESHARQLVGLKGRIGSLIVVSSASVYADDDGRMLLGSDHGDERLIHESHPVVAPIADGSDYAGGKVAVENALLADPPAPTTILRPGAIFGPSDGGPREWHFVKRILDGRTQVPVAYDGASRFHHVSSRNLALVTVASARSPETRVLNVGDPIVRDVGEIAATVTRVMDRALEVVPFPGPPKGTVGDTPWTVPHPFVMDTSAAQDVTGELGDGYDEDLAAICEWLVAEAATKPWRDAFPRAAQYYGELFDYEAEDAFLSETGRRSE